MKSPFPGMDPYLEARWPGVHVLLLTHITEILQPQLPPALRARAEERLLLESTEDAGLQIHYRPDVSVVEVHPRSASAPADSIATVDPVAVTIEIPDIYDRFVKIIDISSGNRVITVIEVLSPWNKLPGRLNEKYRQKIADYQSAGVNVVEIDLLRSPRDHLPVPQELLPAESRAPYTACVWFARERNRWYAYPMPLRLPLPTIPIPLRPQDPTLGLALQPLIDRAYVGGGYDDIDYSQPPSPPLSPDDAAWADQLLRAAGNRPAPAAP